jgi:hypothetical protein
MDPHAFQFGTRGPYRPQSAHRNYPSVDVIEVSIQRFSISSLNKSAHPSEGEFVKGSNLGLVGAAKTPDQPTQRSASPLERHSVPERPEDNR